MAKLIYSAIASLDGYIEDEDGKFTWAEPDEEVHAFINDLERPVGTHLLGRRLYEVMIYWETIALATSRRPSRPSRRSGGRPTRSCTRRRCPAPAAARAPRSIGGASSRAFESERRRRASPPKWERVGEPYGSFSDGPVMSNAAILAGARRASVALVGAGFSAAVAACANGPAAA